MQYLTNKILHFPSDVSFWSVGSDETIPPSPVLKLTETSLFLDGVKFDIKGKYENMVCAEAVDVDDLYELVLNLNTNLEHKNSNGNTVYATVQIRKNGDLFGMYHVVSEHVPLNVTPIL